MLNIKLLSRWIYIKIVSSFFHLLVVVWTTRWAIVKNYAAIVRISSAIVRISSAIVRISSEIVRISSEIVEISSELIRISSELISAISELLIISAFKKSPESVSGTLISPWNESKGKLLFFTFIHLSIKSVLCAISCELLSNPKWLKVVLWGLGRGGCQKSRLIFIITNTDSIQHRPIFLLPLQGQQQHCWRW